jgi:nitrogen regulatory protein PII-like uncharacterized protein
MGITKMAKITQFSALNLTKEAGVDPHTWNTLPDDDVVEQTAKAVESRGIRVIIAGSAQDAMTVLKNIIPAGAEVMNGSSTTLIEIGYEDYISGNESGWNLMHKVITAENNDK